MARRAADLRRPWGGEQLYPVFQFADGAPRPVISRVLKAFGEGTVLYRVHVDHRGATEFNPGVGARSRFAPLTAGQSLAFVPTMDAASTIPGAVSESVFHDVPYRGPASRIIVARLHQMALSTIALTKPMRFALLAGLGLRRLGLRRRDLIDGGPGTYVDTVRWAAALHDCRARPDGLAWTSRQDDTARAFVLFGDRVDRATLRVISAPIALHVAPGLDLVEPAATEAGITVVR